ncbi:hypothetical protein LINPERHAP2_LOCUS21762 [Linum perenne]
MQDTRRLLCRQTLRWQFSSLRMSQVQTITTFIGKGIVQLTSWLALGTRGRLAFTLSPLLIVIWVFIFCMTLWGFLNPVLS